VVCLGAGGELRSGWELGESFGGFVEGASDCVGWVRGVNLDCRYLRLLCGFGDREIIARILSLNSGGIRPGAWSDFG
jgi:hypothetical protein